MLLLRAISSIIRLNPVFPDQGFSELQVVKNLEAQKIYCQIFINVLLCKK